MEHGIDIVPVPDNGSVYRKESLKFRGPDLIQVMKRWEFVKISSFVDQ